MQNSVLRYLENTANCFNNKRAVVDQNGEVTFDELRKRALMIGIEISNRLHDHQQPIFVFLPKSIEMIEVFLGILYSGNFYTPTDVRFPKAKIRSVFDALEPKLVITSKQYKKDILEIGIDDSIILCVDDICEDVLGTLYYEKTIDTDIAYILFTSGSTGIPKGVMISHRSIIDYIDWAKECYKIDSNCIIGNQAPFYFDNSTLDIYLMLSSGAELHIIPEQYYSFPARLLDYVSDNQINTIFWVPSVFGNIKNADLLGRIDCRCLKKILFAGEVMPNKFLNYWRNNIPDALYSNLYGPTEITVDCTYYIVNREFKDDEALPIGIPCPNTEILVLDEEKNLITESGVIGELCVRGSSLAIGYWNDPKKTNEVFIQNPLNARYNERIYCTGDLVHYNELGEIMYDGRKDYQIKHFGYRIELGEIEVAAMGCAGLANAIAAYDYEDKKIVLFYQGNVFEGYVKKYLLQTIPKYMVPTVYYPLDSLPYNDNGKIDRKRLSEEYILAKK